MNRSFTAYVEDVAIHDYYIYRTIMYFQEQLRNTYNIKYNSKLIEDLNECITKYKDENDYNMLIDLEYILRDALNDNYVDNKLIQELIIPNKYFEKINYGFKINKYLIE